MAKDPYSRKPERLFRDDAKPAAPDVDRPPAPEYIAVGAPPPKKVITQNNCAYLTIITWPKDIINRPQQAELLAASGVIDPASANLVVARFPPFIAGLYETSAARGAAAHIRSAGGDAFAPTIADLAATGATLKIRDLSVADGNLHVTIWRGPEAVIRPENIQFLIRGTLDNTTEIERDQRVADRVQDDVRERTAAVRYGWAMQLAAEDTIDAMRQQAATLKLSEKIDLHTSDGSVFQIDGDKFAYRALGEMRGHSDFVNMNRMLELLAHLTPHAVIDGYFRLFRAPTAIKRLELALPSIRRNEEDLPFAFYSRWAALMYRHVMSAPRS